MYKKNTFPKIDLRNYCIRAAISRLLCRLNTVLLYVKKSKESFYIARLSTEQTRSAVNCTALQRVPSEHSLIWTRNTAHKFTSRPFKLPRARQKKIHSCTGRGSNPGPLAWEASVLTTGLLRLETNRSFKSVEAV